MMLAQAPRHFHAGGLLPGTGMPHDRQSRLAARRAFVALKQAFVDTVAALPGPRGIWLRRQVRSTEEPIDLWLLRAMVFTELDASDARDGSIDGARRQRLRQSLATVFPDTLPPSGYDNDWPTAQRPRPSSSTLSQALCMVGVSQAPG